MSAHMLTTAMEQEVSPCSSLGERLIHLEMCYAADRRGMVRLSQTDLSARLGVTRQAIVKHVETLMKKRLVRRQQHGRYAVYLTPWTVEEEISRYLDTLRSGEEVVMDVVSQRLTGMDMVDYENPMHAELLAAGQSFVGTRIHEDAEGVWRLRKAP